MFKPAVNSTAFMKVGFFGFQGSGKTHTAMDFAIGLAKLENKTKIAFFDTEKGSDFHIKRCLAAGIQLDVLKSRSFKDCVAAIKEAENGQYGALVIDSMTHVWREICDSYLSAKLDRVKRFAKNKNQKITVNLTMKDWVSLKAEWGVLSDLFVSSKIHILACGRAGHEYDVSQDDEGKQEIVKSGTKMKAEGEFGYESDLLLEMLRVPIAHLNGDKKAKGFVNRCVVLKDRTDQMNAVSIDKPKFKDFSKIVKCLNIGGEHHGTDLTRNSSDIFGSPAEYSVKQMEIKRNILIEELGDCLVKLEMSGTSKDAQKKRVENLEKYFGKSSKTYIENMDLEDLERCLHNLKKDHKLLPPEEQELVNDSFEGPVSEADIQGDVFDAQEEKKAENF